MPEEKTTRVTMLWPEEVKDAVREKVGARGLTGFTLEAVKAKLGTHDVHQADSKELNEVKFLAQRLADAIAMGGDYEDRESTLRLMELPDWIQTVGWPEHLAELVKPEDSTPEPVQAEASTDDDEDDDLHRPMALTKPRDPGPPQVRTTTAQPLPHDRSDDFLAKVLAKGAEKGVDLTSANLKPASSIEKAEEPPAIPVDEEPSAAEEPAMGSESDLDDAPEPNQALRDQVAQPRVFEQVDAPTPISNPNACPKCGSELVGGECWECF